ncbi:MAG: hydroxymyristoyl-ACP dehydratase [Steroidobacteraceae bacterium]
MRLDRRWIQAHIPHQNGMCLLDEVLSWDGTRASCRSSTHRSAENPLRAYGRLGVACGIEYAAQTMAVHGALVASTAGVSAAPGFLASARGVQFNCDRLDDIQGDLVTAVERLAGNVNTALYEFSVSADEVVLLTGRAAIAFDVFGSRAGADGAGSQRTGADRPPAANQELP